MFGHVREPFSLFAHRVCDRCFSTLPLVQEPGENALPFLGSKDTVTLEVTLRWFGAGKTWSRWRLGIQGGVEIQTLLHGDKKDKDQI